MRGFIVPAKDTSELSGADTNGFLQHRLEHHLKTAGGPTDDFKHFRRRRLLDQRFRAVGCAFSVVGAALSWLVGDPRVLECDDGLGREVRYECDLLVAEGSHFLTRQVERPDQFSVFQHRNYQQGPNSAEFDSGNHPFIVSFNVVLFLSKVCDVDYLFVAYHLAYGVFTAKRQSEGQAPACLEERWWSVVRRDEFQVLSVPAMDI